MSGMRNKRWSRDNVTIGQVWHARRYPDEMWRVVQCHHADEQIVFAPDVVLAQPKDYRSVGTSELRKYWERVS